MTSKTHQFKNAMRLYATELICSTRVSGFQIFELLFCIHIKLRVHAKILKGHRQPQVFAGVQAIGAIFCNTETSIS